MKNLLGVLLLSSVLIGATASASEGDVIRICGTVYVNGEVKGVAVDSTKTSYELIISEVAEPKGNEQKLINYQSSVFTGLNTGDSICVIGVEGESRDTRYPTVNLTLWAVISGT